MTEMRGRAVSIIACLLACGPALAASPAARLDPQGPLYKAASAHAPNFASKALWPYAVEKTAYTRETWPPARVLVWAAEEAPRRGTIAFADPANWTTPDGKPVARPPDEATDVVFPAGCRFNTKEPFMARHVTVEPGAHVVVWNVQMTGNLWVKEGATYRRMKGVFGAADRDTFARSDNDEIVFIPNNLTVNKRMDKSLEWLGRWKIADEINMNSGSFIVGPGSLFQHTDRRRSVIRADGALVLMSGATFEGRGNVYQGSDLEVDGRVLAGTPARPLTRDCVLGLSFKPNLDPEGSPRARRRPRDDVGLNLRPGASLVVTSADPKTARLVFRWHRNPPETKPFENGEPREIAALPHGIAMNLLGEARLNGVEFNDVLKGGIRLPDLAARRAWQNVVFGRGNFGKPDELFAIQGAGKRSRPN